MASQAAITARPAATAAMIQRRRGLRLAWLGDCVVCSLEGIVQDP
jgi:hypothetical protein